MLGASDNTKSSWIFDLLFLTVILGCVFFILTGARPLFVPDEGRYAEIAREMLASGDFITPTLNGVYYFEKPILFYWLGAAAFKLGGIHIASIRAVNAFLGLFGCLLTYVVTRVCYGRTTGLYAALILGTSLLYFIMSEMVSLDLPVTVLISASVYLLILSMQFTGAQARFTCFCLSALASGLAVLTKGLIGIVFPFAIFIPWLIMAGQRREITIKRLLVYVSIVALVIAPWHILVQLRHPSFFHFYVIEQHFLRYTDLNIGHYQPAWFFIPCLLIGFIPWSAFLPQALFFAYQQRQQPAKKLKLALLFLWWAGFVLTFFSFSKSKLIPYILPLFPPLAVLMACYLTKGEPHRRGIRIGYMVLTVFAVGLVAASYLFLRNSPIPYPITAKLFLTEAVLLFLLGAVLALFIAYRSTTKATIVTFASAAVFMLCLITSMPALDTRTIMPFAKLLTPLLTPDDEVIAYHQYYQDLPFYLQRTITVVDWRNELAHGMELADTTGWMIQEKAFWKRFNGRSRVFVILSRDEYELMLKKHPKAKAYLLDKSINNALISNRKIRNFPLKSTRT